MADGNALILPIYDGLVTPDDAILGLEIARVVISGDTTAVGYDLRIDSDDSGTPVPVVVIPNQTYIWDVGWKVTTAFVAATILSIGDSDDADGWASSANLAATTADTDISWAGHTALLALQTYAEAIDARVSLIHGTSDLAADTTVGPAVSAVTIPTYGFSGGRFIGGDTTVADTFGIWLTIDAPAGGPTLGNLEVFVKFSRVWGRNRRIGTAA